jgi:predicted nucleic acid-binding protein
MRGAYHAHDRAVALAALHQFLRGKSHLPLTTAIMETFGIVRANLSRPLRQQIGDLHLPIAATAMTHDLSLLTRNLRDFQHIPDLKLYRPTWRHLSTGPPPARRRSRFRPRGDGPHDGYVARR